MADDPKSKLVEEILATFNRISGDRGNWESHWEEIAERMYPAHRDIMRLHQFSYPGQKKNEFIFDSTPVIALERFTAIITSLLTPENAMWHRLIPTDDYLAENREVRLWFEKANKVLWNQRRRPAANFMGQNIQTYESLGAFGTGLMFIDENRIQSGLRYRSLPLGSTFICENHQGQVDTVYRQYKADYTKLRDRFPEDMIPDEVKRQSEDSKNRPKEYTVIHCVRPNREYDPYRLDSFYGRPFMSAYILKETKTVLELSGYRSFPIPCGRYRQVPGEVYGRSPAMSALPATKTLNEEKKTILKQGHRTVDPVLLAHDDGVIDGFSMRPGALNFGGVNEDGRALIHTLPVGNVAIGKDMMDDERAIINDAFLVNLFQILTENPRMTATEVIERTREKGILLAPTIGRQQSEYLGPMVEREVDILMDQGLLPPMPQILLEAEGEYRVEYDNPMSRAARSEEAAGLIRSLETTLNIVNTTGDPEPLDYYDWDKIVPEVNQVNGTPEGWMRSKEDVAARRAARAEQADQQQLMEGAKPAAELIKATNGGR